MCIASAAVVVLRARRARRVGIEEQIGLLRQVQAVLHNIAVRSGLAAHRLVLRCHHADRDAADERAEQQAGHDPQEARRFKRLVRQVPRVCLLYTSDAADEL